MQSRGHTRKATSSHTMRSAPNTRRIICIQSASHARSVELAQLELAQLLGLLVHARRVLGGRRPHRRVLGR